MGAIDGLKTKNFADGADNAGSPVFGALPLTHALMRKAKITD
jgi:hypothetical protein